MCKAHCSWEGVSEKWSRSVSQVFPTPNHVDKWAGTRLSTHFYLTSSETRRCMEPSARERWVSKKRSRGISPAFPTLTMSTSEQARVWLVVAIVTWPRLAARVYAAPGMMIAFTLKLIDSKSNCPIGLWNCRHSAATTDSWVFLMGEKYSYSKG